MDLPFIVRDQLNILKNGITLSKPTMADQINKYHLLDFDPRNEEALIPQ
jgi:hypothetical protein